MNCLLQLDRLTQFLIHHVSLPHLSLTLCLHILLIVGAILLDQLLVKLLGLLVLKVLLVGVVVDDVLEVLVKLLHLLLVLLLL